MAGEWPEMTLGDFVSLQRGHDLTDDERRVGDVPVMGSAGQNGFHDTARAKGPGIVIGRSGASFGKVHYAESDYWPHNTALYVTDFKGNDPRFAYYFLSSINFDRFNSGSAQPSLNRNFIYPIPVRIPPLPEQKAIARILGTLDDKIELNRRMNATLEAMARALFRSWFVDFDPVRRNAGSARSGRKSEKGKMKSENSESSAPAHFSLPTSHFAFDSLFPASFQDSELGEIPAGWTIKSIGEVIELAYGKPLKAEDRKNGQVAVYGSNGQVGWHNEKLVTGPGIIVGRKGNPGIVTWAHDDFYPIDTTFYVVPVSVCESYYYLYYALLAQNLANLGADSAVPGLNRNQAYMSKLLIPPADLLKEFDIQTAPLFSKIHSNEMQSRALSSLRDTLLPRLLSGKITIS